MSNNPFFIEGQKLYKAKKFSEAIENFSKAIEKEENPYIYYERGMSYLHSRNFSLALSDLNTAAELQPENPFRFSSRAYVKDLMGDYIGAVEDYERCLKLDPNDAVALNNLGIIEDKLGRKEKAKKLVKRTDKLAAADEFLFQQRQKSFDKNIEKPPTKKSFKSIVKEVLTSKDGWAELFTFVKNGFKLK